MIAPEFSRPVRIDTVGEIPREIVIEAEQAERDALARRFGLPGIAKLRAELSLVRSDTRLVATGRLVAEATQSCVATALPVVANVDQPFEIHFLPHPGADQPEEEVELGEEDMDVVFYDGASIDIGDAVAETLSLMLDPYPRAPGAEEVLRQAGVKNEEEAGPFGVLASLRDKLSKK